MKKLHPLSFFTGLGSGILILLLVFGAMRLLNPGRRGFGGQGGFGQQFNNGSGPNLARMAERMGITQEELQKELDSGKTMQQVADEHGVTFGSGRNAGGQGGRTTGSGATASGTMTISSSLSSSK